MKNSIKYLLLSAAALAAVSCESWLDVTPPSEIRAEAHYSSAEGFQQTLIGCYLAMGETDLYGENLTWHMVEILGRQYDARKNTAADDYDLDRYNYKTTKSTEVIEKVWEKSYSVIANVNDALDHIDRRKDELDSVNYRIIKGELLAVRAYIHFDLIRLFGCSDLAGRTDLESRHTVPYLTSVDKDAAPQLTYAETLRRMIADLTEAARLLEIDPIRARYPESIYTEANVDKFYDYRYMHLNYFAVKALLARVCMWEGSDENKHTALLAALEVIDDPASVGIAGGLTLRTFTDSAKAPTTEMCFPSEHIFALGVTDMAKKIASNLNREYSEQDRQYRTLCIKNSVADDLFEIKGAGISDCRYKQLYHNTNYWPEGTKTPSKLYQQTSDPPAGDVLHRRRVPHLRSGQGPRRSPQPVAGGAQGPRGLRRTGCRPRRGGPDGPARKGVPQGVHLRRRGLLFLQAAGLRETAPPERRDERQQGHRRRRLHAALPRFRNTVGTRTVSRTINC